MTDLFHHFFAAGLQHLLPLLLPFFGCLNSKSTSTQASTQESLETAGASSPLTTAGGDAVSGIKAGGGVDTSTTAGGSGVGNQVAQGNVVTDGATNISGGSTLNTGNQSAGNQTNNYNGVDGDELADIVGNISGAVTQSAVGALSGSVAQSSPVATGEIGNLAAVNATPGTGVNVLAGEIGSAWSNLGAFKYVILAALGLAGWLYFRRKNA